MGYRISGQEDSRLLSLAKQGARNGWPLIPVQFLANGEDGGAWLIPCTTYLDPEEDDSISIVCLADIAEDSYLGFTIGEQGFGFLHYESDMSLLSYLLEEGIAPGQDYYALVTVQSSRSYEGEYDEWWASALVFAEPLSAFGHERAWEEWLMEHGKARRWFDDARATQAARLAKEQYWFVCVEKYQYTQDLCASLMSTVPMGDFDPYSNGTTVVSSAVPLVKRAGNMRAAMAAKGWGSYPIATSSDGLAKYIIESLTPSGSWYHLSALSEEVKLGGKSCWLLPSADSMDSEWRIADARDRLDGAEEEEGEQAWG